MTAATRLEDSALFVYGSLLEASRRAALLGRAVQTVDARLVDYELRRGRYFYVVKQSGSATAGLVLLGLQASDFETLDRYEEVPHLYTRERAEVIDAHGGILRCWLYLPTARLLCGPA